MKEIIKKYIDYVIVVCGIISFAVIAFLVERDGLTWFDTFAYDHFVPFINDVNTNIVKVITDFSSATAVVGISILCLLCIKEKKYGILIALNMLFCDVLNTVLKLCFNRPRPTVHPIIDMPGFSFPSGHAMMSMAFYGLIFYLVKNYMNHKARKPLLILLPLVIFLVGCSRIYLGVHFASDIVAGFIVGFTWLTVFIHIFIKKQFLSKIFGRFAKK